MRLNHNIDLGYCTNIHRGETWVETFANLEAYTLQVMDRVCPNGPYGIGLRLSHAAAEELRQGDNLLNFERWLDRHHCYVFTINGFPYGKFHGTRVKEQVYSPDWTSSLRLDYTNLLFDLLGELLPEGRQGSVSTLPGSFKEFLDVGGDGPAGGDEEGTQHSGGDRQTPRPAVSFDEFIQSDDPRLDAICRSLRLCSRHIAELRERTGKDFHLGLEPEPLGLFETSKETVAFFERLTDGVEDRKGFLEMIGVNYDTCHLAVEFEEAGEALGRLRDAGIRISKVHLSSALKLSPTADAVQHLKAFREDTYLHQVVVKDRGGGLKRFRDLPPAIDFAREHPGDAGEEWRVHFHIPLHADPQDLFSDTRDHIEGVLALLQEDPGMCQHLEMETYTWEVLPRELHCDDVVDQLYREYEWCLGRLRRYGLYE